MLIPPFLLLALAMASIVCVSSTTTNLTVDMSGGPTPLSDNPSLMKCHLDEGYVHAAWSLNANLIMGSAFHPEAKWNNLVLGGGSLISELDKSTLFYGLPTWALTYSGGTGVAGITNRNMGNEGLYLSPNLQYEGYVVAKADDNATTSLLVSLRDHVSNTTLASTTLTLPGDGAWHNLSFTLPPLPTGTTCTGITPGSDKSIDCGTVWPNPAHICVACSGEFFVGLPSPSSVHLSYVYAQPPSSARFAGLPVKAQGVATLQAMGVTGVRVGGTYAQGVYWKDWRGPPAHRPTRWFNAGDYNNIGGFGMFEMLDVLEAMGVEAIVTMSRNHSTEDVGDLVEYAYGNETTPWGAVRIFNDSHPAPFSSLTGVELGNEQPGEDWVGQVLAMEAKAAALGLSPSPFFYPYPENALHVEDLVALKAGGVPGDKIMADVHGGWGGNLAGIEASIRGAQAEDYPISGLNCETNGLFSTFSRAEQEAFDLIDFDNAPADILPRIKGRMISFCNERSGHFTRYDQGASYWLPNATWFAPPGYVHVMRHDACGGGGGGNTTVRCGVRAPVTPPSPFSSSSSSVSSSLYSATLQGQPPLPALLVWSASTSPNHTSGVLRLVNAQNASASVSISLANVPGGVAMVAWGSILDGGGDMNATNTPGNPTAVSPQPFSVVLGQPFELPPLTLALVHFDPA